MAKKHLPWEEIVLWSLLGGVLAVGLGWVGLTMYRWFWNEQALISLTGDQSKLYSLAVCGVGALVTAIVLWFGARREIPTFERKEITQKRRKAG
jgi:hypothetical protein